MKAVYSFQCESGCSEQPTEQWFHWGWCVPVQPQQNWTSVQDCSSQELQYASVMVNFHHFLACFGNLSRDVGCQGSGLLHLVSNTYAWSDQSGRGKETDLMTVVVWIAMNFVSLPEVISVVYWSMLNINRFILGLIRHLRKNAANPLFLLLRQTVI